MGRYGVISDIHGNLFALQAVLSRLSELNIEQLICLGDIVGYGPFPDNCLDLVHKHCTVIVQGNHDEAVVDLACAQTFNGPARMAIEWTRDQLDTNHLDALDRLPAIAYVDRRVMCIHASPGPDSDDYVHDKAAAAAAFGGMDRQICLLGHTHVPVVFETDVMTAGAAARPGDIASYLPGDGLVHRFDDEHRYICNPGSVGQPRDCDPRASFAVLDTDEWTFTVFRETYDIRSAQEATERAGLPMVLAERLAIGA